MAKNEVVRALAKVMKDCGRITGTRITLMGRGEREREGCRGEASI